MANPSVTLRRGRGWTNLGWHENRPILDKANMKAARGIGYLSLSYKRSKVGVVNRYPAGEAPNDTVGRAFDEKEFCLYVETIDGGKLRAIRYSHQWSATIVHEVVHCIRSEYFDRGDDFVELAASEGLAHSAENLYIDEFGGQQVSSDFFEWDLERPNPELLAGFNSIVRGRPFDYSRHKQWFDGRTKNSFTRDGSLLGTQLVYRQTEKGYELPELIRWPAEEVLGLE